MLLDVHMPGGGGRAVLEGVLKTHPDIRFLALSVSDNPEDAVDVIQAGARGYVTKSVMTEDLLDAIQRVADGDAVFSPLLAGFVLDAFSSVQLVDVDVELDSLSGRERVNSICRIAMNLPTGQRDAGSSEAESASRPVWVCTGGPRPSLLLP